MKNFKLIFDECEKLNAALESTFDRSNLFFFSASISEIVYGIGDNAFVFCYSPERYEIGKTMDLKGVKIRIGFNKERQYSINELSSFWKNECKFYDTSDMSYGYKSVKEHVDTIVSLLDYMNLNKTNWEDLFVSYKRNITAKWWE